MVEPISIAAGVANITSAIPVVQDAMTSGANFMVTNTVGAVMLAMVVVGFGLAVVVKLVRGRRGRR